MANTGFFFDNVLRFYKRDIDFSPDVGVSDQFYLDIYFKVTEEHVGKEMIEEWDRIIGQIDKIETMNADNKITLTKTEPIVEKKVEITQPDENFAIHEEVQVPDKVKEEQAAKEAQEKEALQAKDALMEKILEGEQVDVDQEIDDYLTKLEEN
eukprot:TRINITY_DN9569_c0_g2_i1.p1 TRINITY_DN9569_c0_g2~~TRINITY_DN9569_c0_g2_i1.p1  ORF type:complete len:153 (+),score=54.93 TRINITY_DN9569_c0_g2_i1:428-886(+)